MSDIEQTNDHTIEVYSEDSNQDSNQQQDSKSKTKSFSEFVGDFDSSFGEFISKYEEFLEKQEEYEKRKKEFESIQKDFNKSMKSMFKLVQTFTGKLEKVHLKDKPKKPRKKTENSGKSGFNKPAHVPEKLRKYLEIEEGTEMTRPQILKMLNAKFQADGFKEDGCTVISSSKAAKKLGVSKGYSIKSNEYHKFIASFFKTNEETSNA
jgi:hypothetical protein